MTSEVALGVEPEPRISYLTWRWAQPYVEMGRDTRVVLHGEHVIGFAMVHREQDVGPVIAMGRVHPSHIGRGIGSWLITFGEGEAHRRASSILRTVVPREDDHAAGLLRGRGYRRVRSAFDMGTTLLGDERAGPVPDGVRIRPFERGWDERETWRVESTAFRDAWDHVAEPAFETWEHEWFGAGAAAKVVLAEVDGRAVGEVAWEAVQGGAYILSVGVLAPFRRRGIAGALLRRAIADVAAEGHRDVYLSVDAESPTGAVGVYERAGLTVRRTSDVYERDLARG